MLKHEGLARTGISLFLGGEFQVGSLGRRIDFPGIRRGPIAGNTGLQLGLVGGFGGGAAFTGNQGLGTDLCRLYAVISIGRPCRWMNRLDHRGENFHAAVEFLQVGLDRPANFFGEPDPVFTEQTVEGPRGEVVDQNAAGGAADQGRHVRAVISRRQRGLIIQTDAIDKPDVHVDDLEALFVGTAAGNHLGFVIHMAGVPQPVGRYRRRAFGGVGLHGC